MFWRLPVGKIDNIIHARTSATHHVLTVPRANLVSSTKHTLSRPRSGPLAIPSNIDSQKGPPTNNH